MVAPTGFKIGTTSVTEAIAFTLNERTTGGGNVGDLAILDADNPAENTYTYTLITSDTDGTAKADNVYDIIRNPDTGLSSLVVKAGTILDYETLAHQSRDLWIQASDGTDTVVFKVTMKANGINEAPTDVTLSGATIAENAASGTAIGLLSALDPDLNDTFRFALKDNRSGAFKIEGNKLIVADGAKLDYEAASSHQIKVEVTDAGGLTFEKSLTISLSDGMDTFIGTKRNDKIAGTLGVDMIDGGSGNDKIYGLSGDDVINGGLGKDFLSGGGGKDLFVFNTPIKKGEFDQITDFNSADDSLQFSLSALKSFKIKAFKKGKLNKKFFTVGDESKDGNDYIYYNKKKGFVYLDSDGEGEKKGIEILKVKPGTNLAADDFIFI